MTNKGVKILVWIMLVIVILLTALFELEKKVNRSDYGIIADGIITGYGKRAKGEKYVAYTFKVDNKQYAGTVSFSFCNECDTGCCRIGGIVKVRFQKGKPENNDLIH